MPAECRRSKRQVSPLRIARRGSLCRSNHYTASVAHLAGVGVSRALGCQMGQDFGLDAVTRSIADDALDWRTAYEQYQGGQTHDAVLLGDVWTEVAVQQTDAQFAFVLAGDLAHDGRKHLTGRTPIGGELDQHGQGRFKYLRAKIGFGSFKGLVIYGTHPFGNE